MSRMRRYRSLSRLRASRIGAGWGWQSRAAPRLRMRIRMARISRGSIPILDHRVKINNLRDYNTKVSEHE
jgi:hypothetical protein